MEKKYIIKKDILYYIIIFFFLLYFTIHSFYGDRGFVSYCLLQKKIESKFANPKELIFTVNPNK